MLPSRLYRALGEEAAVTVVDLRNLAAYEQAHITDAVHIPTEELADRVRELDRDRTIVFYCLSPNEATSLQAAMTLYRSGFTKVAVLDGGIQKWYSDGYPIEGTILTPTPRLIGPPWTVTTLPTLTPLPTAIRTRASVQQTPTSVQGTRTITPTATKAG